MTGRPAPLGPLSSAVLLLLLAVTLFLLAELVLRLAGPSL